MERKDWIWMPHPAHLCVAHECRFHLATYVGGYIVSTVGEWFPGEGVREILARERGIELKGRGDDRERDYMCKIGYEEIGAGRMYETMVFPAGESKADCCPYVPTDYLEIEAQGYNDAADACKGHMELCEKWAKEAPLVRDDLPTMKHILHNVKRGDQCDNFDLYDWERDGEDENGG